MVEEIRRAKRRSDGIALDEIEIRFHDPEYGDLYLYIPEVHYHKIKEVAKEIRWE